MKGKRLIVVYHRIGDTTYDYNRIVVKPDVFISHLDYFQKNYLVLSLDELHEYDGEMDAIAITFDDGYDDFCTTAFPIMKSRNIPSAIFLCSCNVDRCEEMWMNEAIRICFFHSSYVEKIAFNYSGIDIELPLKSIDDRVRTYNVLRRMFGQIGNAEQRKLYIQSLQKQVGLPCEGRAEYKMLTSAQIKEISSERLITIGAHTVSHPLLGGLDEEECLVEIRESIRDIKQITNKKVELFSYPFGGIDSYNNKIIDILRDEGIKKAYTVENRYVNDGEDDYTIPRIYMYDIKSLELEYYLANIGNSPCAISNDIYFGRAENDKLGNLDKVLIFGTGDNAKTVASIVMQANIRIIAFVVSERKENTFLGEQVWSISEMMEYAKNEALIIKNNNDFRIVEKLCEIGKSKIHWWI